MNDFSLTTAQSLVNSEEKFPVDFENAWQWLDYSRKDVAKRSFEKCGFEENLDYTSFRQVVEREIGATQKEIIMLSIDCFKTWAMMSNTEKGKQVRLYFLECERIAKEKSIVAVPTLPRQTHSSVEYIEAGTKLAQLPESRLKRLLAYKLESELALDVANEQRLLKGDNPEEKPLVSCTTANVRAGQLGYSHHEIGNGSALGRYIKKRVTPVFSDWQGQYQVWHYEVSETLDSHIHQFFKNRPKK